MADLMNDNPAADTAAAPRTAPTRRRAASRPAGPPPDPAASPADAAPAKKTTRSRKKATPAAQTPPTAPPAPAAEVPAAAADAPAAKKTTRSRSRKASAPAGSPDAIAAAVTGDSAPDAAPDSSADSAAAAAPKASRTRKAPVTPAPLFQAPDPVAARPARAKKKAAGTSDTAADAGGDTAPAGVDATAVAGEPAADAETTGEGAPSRSRRRRGRGSGGSAAGAGESTEPTETTNTEAAGDDTEGAAGESGEEGESTGSSSRRRRRRRRRGGGGGGDEGGDEPTRPAGHARESRSHDEVASVRGSTRLEAKKQRRREGRASGRRRAPILTEAEFLARRESVERVMVVRDNGERTQIAVLEDDVLVEHYVDRKGTTSLIGNVYLGKVQNVLPSMEAAFVDIGRGRNAVLYAGEVNWDAAGLEGQPKRIEHALKSGESVLVQVTKDPIGHKGARLTAQVTLPGRFLVYVPDGSLTGISRKLPDTERTRLKSILKGVVPEDAGVIVRTAAEGASEDELTRDVARLRAQWEDIEKKAKTASAPAALYTEPDLTVRVVRDLFNEDFAKLVVSGADAQDVVEAYVGHVAADLADRVERWAGDGDVFASYRVDEQLEKALERKVWLPSGGSLVIDRTEAMTVIDVNTGKFTGSGGNLEETVTKNNLEAAEEIVRQLRLRDIGGIVVVDFIDMVLERNRDLVLRRLTECLSRDRTKHQVAEVSTLGLVQMTRKRIGLGLLEAFSEPCEHCKGRGVIVHAEPVDAPKPARAEQPEQRRRGKKSSASSSS